MEMYEKMEEKAILATSIKRSSKIVKTIKRENIEELNLSMQSMKEQSKNERQPLGITMYESSGIYSSADTSFENRYKKILEGVNEEELAQLPNPHENNIVDSIDEIDCDEDGFIARYCLGDVVSIDEAPQPTKRRVLKK